MEKSISRCSDHPDSQPDKPDRAYDHASDTSGQVNKKSEMKNHSDKYQLIDEGSEQAQYGQSSRNQVGPEHGKVYSSKLKTH
jgi:hypothetical protein